MKNHTLLHTTSKRLVLLVAVLLASLFVSQLSVTAKANAYDSARLIDDSIFLDAKSMSASQIQSFLNARGSGIADMEFNLDCDLAGTQAKARYQALDAPCGQNTSSARIIYYASQVYGISPKVILATLQKEQSLITNPNPGSWEINQAMGYNCPTSGHCDDDSGFFWQIDNGTWVLRFHYERADGNNSWWYQSSGWTCGSAKENYYSPNLYPGQNVRFYDPSPYSNGENYATIKIANAATSALYCYTPHVFNNHANSPNPYQVSGSSRCWTFHPAAGSKGICYTGSYNFVKAYNTWFGSTLANSDKSVYRLFNSSSNNHLYTTSYNERQKAVKDANFTYEGVAFNACTSGGKDVYRLYNPTNGRHLFTASTSERDKANSKTNFEYEGVAYKACGTKTVFRLYSSSQQKHFYTTSISERDKLVKNTSFIYEGVAFEVN